MTTLDQLLTDLDEITAPFAFYRTVKPIRAALAARDFNSAYQTAGAALNDVEIRGPMLRTDLNDWRAVAKAHSDSKREARVAA